MKASDTRQDASQSLRRSAQVLPEVSASLALGFRDGIRPRLALMSVLAGFVAFAFWLMMFIVWRTEIWTWTSEAAKWVMNGAISLVWPGLAGSNPEVTAGTDAAPFWEAAGAWLAMSLGSAVNFLLIIATFVLLMMLSMRLYLEFFLMSRVQKQCLIHYPSLPRNVQGSLRVDLLSTLQQLAILCAGLLLLAIPAIGGVIFFLLASYLNVRGLVNDALEDLATVEERRTIVNTLRLPMLLLGMVVTGLLIIPLAGLFIPAIFGASVCHLCMRELTRLRASAPVA